MDRVKFVSVDEINGEAKCVAVDSYCYYADSQREGKQASSAVTQPMKGDHSDRKRRSVGGRRAGFPSRIG